MDRCAAAGSHRPPGVRDDRPFGGPDPPAALFRYSRNRSGDHPVEHLKTFAGILQADSFADYNRLYAAGRSPGPVTEVPCFAHARRKFFELADIAAGKGRKNAPPIDGDIRPVEAEASKAGRQRKAKRVLASLKQVIARIEAGRSYPCNPLSEAALEHACRHWFSFLRAGASKITSESSLVAPYFSQNDQSRPPL